MILPPDQRPTVAISEAARILGISNGTLRNWVTRGYVKCSRTPGGQRRFTPAELQHVLDEYERRGQV